MKTGLNYIVDARNKQLAKGRTVELDVQNNKDNQLIIAAQLISNPDLDNNDIETLEFFIDVSEVAELGWSRGYLKKVMRKPYIERLAIAGGLIAAEIDKILFEEQN